MSRFAAMLALLAAGCGFNPAGGGGDDDGADDAAVNVDAASDPDASDLDGATIDGATIDAATDAATDAAIDGRPDAAVLMCPIGYAPINGSQTMYRIVEINVSWALAAADCNDDDDLGGANSGRTHLVVVGSAAEKTLLTNQPSGNTWVGLSDQAVEGTFVWVTSEDTGGFPMVGQQPPWDTGDPDGGTAENCVRFKNSFDFEDKPCADADSYVCECDRFAPN
jgi:hypothetical protein